MGTCGKLGEFDETDRTVFYLYLNYALIFRKNFAENNSGYRSRDKESKKASDHDMNPIMKSVPFGILDVVSGALSIFFGISAETSDFIADCIES